MQSNICMKTTWTLPDFFGICRHWSRWTLAATPSWSRLWTCMCHSVAISWLAQCLCCIWMAGIKLWGQGFQFPMRRAVLDVSIMGTVSLEPPTVTAGNLSWSSGVEVPWILGWECSPPTCQEKKMIKNVARQSDWVDDFGHFGLLEEFLLGKGWGGQCLVPWVGQARVFRGDCGVQIRASLLLLTFGSFLLPETCDMRMFGCICNLL